MINAENYFVITFKKKLTKFNKKNFLFLFYLSTKSHKYPYV
jgi:hypothetical protein